jgi:hypothetical protein
LCGATGAAESHAKIAVLSDFRAFLPVAAPSASSPSFCNHYIISACRRIGRRFVERSLSEFAAAAERSPPDRRHNGIML